MMVPRIQRERGPAHAMRQRGTREQKIDPIRLPQDRQRRLPILCFQHLVS